LFWYDGIVQFLPREFVTEVAALAKLVGEYGHPAGDLQIESPGNEVDIVGYDRPNDDPDRRVLLGVEAKVSEREHELLVIGLEACDGSGTSHDHRDRVLAMSAGSLAAEMASNHHKKCAWISAERPGTVWVVSPGRSDVFRVPCTRGEEFALGLLDQAELERDAVEARRCA
jgi:hypothetical protein